jgi:endo-1,4-beta-xylanase
LSEGLSRRSFLYGASALLAGTAHLGATPANSPQVPDTAALKRAGKESGKTLATFTVQHQLVYDPVGAATIANTFSMIADGNDLKFSQFLRPTPETWNFSFGDTVVSWAEQHGLLFRGHCLIWWNALPDWFGSYVTAANAKRVMTDHINHVVKHYAGRVYSWDVVNEPIFSDGPDGLRRKPWLDLVGADYIDIAFHTAQAADPKARLVLNECYIEHDTPAEIQRRAQLLALVTRLKRAGVPITTLGVQGHLHGNTALDKPGMTKFLKQVQDLGLDIMVTEFDVDDVDVPGPLIDQTVARKYAEFIDLVGPFVKVITFEELNDEPTYPKRPDGIVPRPNLFGVDYRPKPAYSSTVKALMALQGQKG